MLRLDKIHPVISGNKLFKLYYFLEDAKKNEHKKIITFGGAFSNHLAATAFACHALNRECIGIVRGEEPQKLSHTLSFCKEHGMQLQFISREEYSAIKENIFLEALQNKHGNHVLISEGGYSEKGKQGASLITQFFAGADFTHVALAVGTATTLAGIAEVNTSGAEVMGFGVLKNLHDIEKRFMELKVSSGVKYVFNNDYHFGGYARKTNELISFINQFCREQNIPLDFVYTAKMMYGINDLVRKKYFPEGSRILCIHTGGLQGNDSLPEGTLLF
jgi:1-aminocyclopropane-1-carboxylate deaminase/D-cysteine desulfhydrase-like pyridoxal-dependent ACC family enzyme